MSNPNVVSLSLAREMRKLQESDPTYQIQVLRLDKLGLLEEMMKFQEERSRSGALTLKMMIQGHILFKALEENSETHELRALTRSYRRHLKYELEAYLRNGPSTPIAS